VDEANEDTRRKGVVSDVYPDSTMTGRPSVACHIREFNDRPRTNHTLLNEIRLTKQRLDNIEKSLLRMEPDQTSINNKVDNMERLIKDIYTMLSLPSAPRACQVNSGSDSGCFSASSSVPASIAQWETRRPTSGDSAVYLDTECIRL